MCRAAPACRRPTSLSGNCPNWYRHRFSWPAAVLRRTTEQQPGSILSTGSSDARSELVAETGADGVDVGVNYRRETDVFPLRAQEQAADQVDVDTQARGIAIDQMIVLGVVRGQWLQRGEYPEYRSTHGVRNQDRAGDVGVAERETAEEIRQETSERIRRPATECRHVRNRDRRR